MYVRKTVDEYEIRGNYGHGYEMVTTEKTLKEAQDMKCCYIENERGIPFKIVRKRVRKKEAKVEEIAC